MVVIQLSILTLLKIIGLLLLICSGVIIYLVVQSKRETKRLQEKYAYIKKTENLWQDYLLADGVFTNKFIPKKVGEIKAVEEIFLSYLKNISDDMMRLKINQFAKAYLKTYYKKQLKSRNWSSRINALYKIIDFQIEELQDDCEKILKNKYSKEEKFQLLIIKSIFQKEQFIQQLLNSNIAISESEYKQLFAYLEEEMLYDLLENIEVLDEGAKCALVDTIAANGNMLFIDELKQLLTSENTEIRIRTLKALEKIGIVTDVEDFIPFLHSSLWEERLMVAKLLKHIPLSYSGDYLKVLLQDTNWWVRSQAANTMIDLRQGAEKLNEFIQTSTDPYAKEIAKEMLAKRMEIV